MGKLLIVAEKPSVARDIAAALGGFRAVNDWLESDSAIISSAIGHLVEIYAPEAETGGRDLASLPVIPPQFALRPIEKTKVQFNLLSRLMARSDVDGVVNACDAGREGELIFRLIYKLANCKKPMKRMWLQSMTPDAIRTAYSGMKLGSAYDRLAAAAECRSESDWLIGINGSRGITYLNERQTLKYDLMSAGRVQTPTLAIVVERERKIRTFVPKDFWEVFGTFSVAAGSYTAKWFSPDAKEETKEEGREDEENSPTRFFDKAKADAIAAKCAGQTPTSVKDECKPVNKNAPKLFDLTSLQREANRRLGMSAKQTLDIAQALYETHKVTTYPRTDSCHLPEDYIETAKKTLGTFAGTSYEEHAQRVLDSGWARPDKRLFDNSKISDHFAIIPTGQKPASLNPRESQIYDMIVLRFLAAFHPAAEYQQTIRTTIVAGEHFKVSGKVLAKPGWLAVYGKDLDDDGKAPALCQYSPGEQVSTIKIEPKGSQTKKPPRFTEDTLLAAMENAGKLIEDEELRDAMKERGLGTPATRASMIETLLHDKDKDGKPKEPYMRREGTSLVPTNKGMNLIAFLEANGIEILASPKLTGDWEHKLHLMEKGQYSRDEFMGEIADLTRKIISVIQEQAANVKVKPGAEITAPCPKCSGTVIETGRFYECKDACGFRMWKEVADRKLSVAEVTALIVERRIGPLNGFVSAKKTKFSAFLKLTDELKVEFEFVEAPKVEITTADGSTVHCPKCGTGVILEGDRFFECQAECGFKFWKEVAERKLTTSEATQLIVDRCVGPLEGFVSKAKKKFSASLKLTDELKVEFSFEERIEVTSDPDGKPVACPKCSQGMHRINGKKGFFWACKDKDNCNEMLDDRNGYPVWKHLTPDGKPAPCPKCHKDMHRAKGKDGFFWACPDRDGCKTYMDDKKGFPVPRGQGDSAASAHKCPASGCGKPMRRIKNTKGYFWGCTGYPDCKHTMDDKNGKPVPKDKTALAGAFL